MRSIPILKIYYHVRGDFLFTYDPVNEIAATGDMSFEKMPMDIVARNMLLKHRKIVEIGYL